MKPIMSKIDDILREFRYRPTTLAIIDGEKVELNEYQVRALQVLCKRAIDADAFDRFTERVTVFTSIDGTRVNRFRPQDAKFVDCFEGGFYNCCSDMSFEIL